MNKKYYLAYGSNLNIVDMLIRCPNFKVIGTTILFNYQLVFKGLDNGKAYLTVEKSEGSYVPLGIYSISSLDERRMDRYEGFLYHKEYIDLNIKNKKVKGLIYIMNDNYDYYLPSKIYFNKCLEGYKDFGFNQILLSKALNDTVHNIQKGKAL